MRVPNRYWEARVVKDRMFRRSDVDGIRTLTLTGEIDLAVQDEFRHQFARLFGEAHSPVAVDLSAVTFLDSSALAVLAEARSAGRAAEIPIILRAPSTQCRRVLEITGLDTLFTIENVPAQ